MHTWTFILDWAEKTENTVYWACVFVLLYIFSAIACNLVICRKYLYHWAHSSIFRFMFKSYILVALPLPFFIPILKSPFSNQGVLRFLSEWHSSAQTAPTIFDWQGAHTFDLPWVSCHQSAIVSIPVQMKTRMSLTERFRYFVVGCNNE